MSEAELTKLTVNIVPKAVDALNHVSEMTQQTKTEVVNRALQIYAHLVDTSWLHGDEHRARWEPGSVGVGPATIVLLPPRSS
jgi:hypothetical protein